MFLGSRFIGVNIRKIGKGGNYLATKLLWGRKTTSGFAWFSGTSTIVKPPPDVRVAIFFYV
ncbi:MAG: hypothetical protein EA411_09525 [Saprospirales bacterium]|nr:MAG: hypothetical protein EA411_09525 [Saprospirales bacterium]